MAFGKEIKRIRENSGITASAIVQAIGIDSLVRYKAWEFNDSTPKHEDRKKIEKFFEMDLEEVMRLDKIPKHLLEKDKKSQLPKKNYIDNQSDNLHTVNDEKPAIVQSYQHRRLRLKNGDGETDSKGIPIYDVPIDASFLERFRDEQYEPLYYLNIPKLRNCNFGAIISGNSMYPIMKSGTIAMCRVIDSFDYIDEGEMYFISTKNGFETVKYVQHGDNKEELRLIPHNEKIRPAVIKKDMVIKMCIVEAWLNFR